MSNDTELEARDIRAGYIAWCRGELPRDMAGEKFDRFINKVRADALREAANALPKSVGLRCNPECHADDPATFARPDRSW